MYKSRVSAKTATGDTAKTLIDSITTPGGVSKIIGVIWNVIGSSTLTIAESVTGLGELESDDIAITPCQHILPMVNLLTSGAIALNPFIQPCDIPVKEGNIIKGYVTMDMAQTGAFTARFQLIYA